MLFLLTSEQQKDVSEEDSSSEDEDSRMMCSLNSKSSSKPKLDLLPNGPGRAVRLEMTNSEDGFVRARSTVTPLRSMSVPCSLHDGYTESSAPPYSSLVCKYHTSTPNYTSNLSEGSPDRSNVCFRTLIRENESPVPLCEGPAVSVTTPNGTLSPVCATQGVPRPSEEDSGHESPTEKEAGSSQTEVYPVPAESWLMRLFQSKLFDMSIAIHYLFNSKEPGVQSYLGNKLFVSLTTYSTCLRSTLHCCDLNSI